MQRMEQPYQMMQNPCTTDQVRFLCGPECLPDGLERAHGHGRSDAAHGAAVPNDAEPLHHGPSALPLRTRCRVPEGAPLGAVSVLRHVPAQEHGAGAPLARALARADGAGVLLAGAHGR